MKNKDIITGIDIGTSAIRIVVGQRDGSGSLQIIGAAEAPSQGVSKGNITDLEEVVSAVSEALERAERMAGAPIERAVIGINGVHIKVIEKQGVVAVSRPNREVEISDTERAIEAAQASAAPPNYEILHVLPLYYTLDNQEQIKDPIGMTGIRLEVTAQIIMGLSSQVKLLSKCVYRTGVDVEGFVFSILGNASAVLDKKKKEIGVVVINIGASTTSMVVFEDNEIIFASVIPVGADHITQDLAVGLRTEMDVAEGVKIEFGSADSTKVSKRDEIDLSTFSDVEQPRTMVSTKHVAEIIEARLEEIFELIDQELKKVDLSAALPGGAILTGGGAKMNGIVEVAKKKLKIPVSIGKPQLAVSHIDKLDDPQFTTALGLVCYAMSGPRKTTLVPNFSSVKLATDRMARWFKELLP